MRRSTLVDGLLLTAVLVSTMSLLAFLRDVPRECPAPNPSGVEELFAPCLAAGQDDARREAALGEWARAGLAPLPPRQPIVADGRPPASQRDVEATGSIAPAR
jgi:hypothetical protein